MPWSYNPLWKLIIDRGIKKTQLIPLSGINTHTLAQMGKNQPVSMDTLDRLCLALDCRIEDIVEHIPSDPK